jgi:tetratricopeptide (TPR) repeat protein
MPIPEGQPIKNQFNDSQFHGSTTFNNQTVYYQEGKDLPRRLTAIPTLQSKVIGRDKDLARLSQQIKDSGTTAIVRGMGGVGKTTLATAYLAREQPNLAHVVWITQTGDFATSLLSGGTTGQARLSELLGVPVTDDPVADAHRLLLELSSLAGPSLLVIDNAEADLNNYLPYLPTKPNWSVILTTRETLNVPGQLQLDNLDEEDALALFQEHYPTATPEEEATARTITQDVGGHALTVELLAKTAVARRLPLKKFYTTLQERGLAIGRRADDINLPHDRDNQLQKVFPYLLAVFDISQLSKACRQILYQFTIFPTNFTDFDLVARLLGKDSDASEDKNGVFTFFSKLIGRSSKKEREWDDFTAQLKTLEKSGWLQRDATRGYRLHQIISKIVRQHPNYTYPSKILDDILERMTAYISYNQYSSTNPVMMVSELSFGDSVASNLKDQDLDTKSLSPFLNRLASLQANFGRYHESTRLFEIALKLDVSRYGEDSDNIQESRSNLANAYRDIGRYKEAAVLLEATLNYQLAHYGKDNIDVPKIQSNLALVYRDLRRYQEAVDLLQVALEQDITHYEDSDPKVQITRSNLAIAYRDVGRYGESAELLETTLKYNLSHYGHDHPTILVLQSNLATTYQSLDRHQTAAKMLEETLKLAKSLYGEEHPTVQVFRSNLASAYEKLSRFEEAIELLKDALKFEILTYGDDHFAVQVSRSSLALAYRDIGLYDEANELLTIALKHLQANSDKNYPEIKNIINLLNWKPC